MSSVKSCVISLPKKECKPDDLSNCRKLSDEGSYPGGNSLGDAVIIASVSLTANVRLDQLYLVFNETAMLSVECDGTEIFRIITGPGNPSIPIPISCIECNEGQTIDLVLCGPCEGDYFACLNYRII